MHNTNSDIELTSQPLRIQRPTSNPQHYHYLPQQDEESIQEISPEASERPQRKGLTLEKANKIAVMLILFIYVIDLFPLCMAYYYELRQESYAHHVEDGVFRSFQLLSANLKADPIMDIKILNHGLTCPPDFQPLKLANWPGTVAGCLCENGDLFNSTCEKLDSPKCKKDIPSTFPIEMYEWDNSIFCVKRAVLGTDYLKKAECPMGYKECYPGGCFKGYCPVTKLEISSTGEMAHRFNGKQKFLTITKTQGEPPLIDIQLSLGNIPCFTQDLSNKTIRNSSYELSAVKENQCDKYGLNSQFSTKLNEQLAYDSFSENSFLYSVMNLPHFKENANSTTSVLSWTTLMKTAKNNHCLEIEESSLENFNNAGLTTLSVLCSAFLIISQCFSPMFRIAAHLDGDTHEKANMKMMKCLFSCHFLSYVQILIEVFWYNFFYLPFQAMEKNMERHISLGCFDGSQGHMVIIDYLASVEIIKNSFPYHVAFFVLNFLPGIVFIWHYIVKRRLGLG